MYLKSLLANAKDQVCTCMPLSLIDNERYLRYNINSSRSKQDDCFWKLECHCPYTGAWRAGAWHITHSVVCARESEAGVNL